MKPYRDIFGNPLYKIDVEAATRLIVTNRKASPLVFQRSLGFGAGKSKRIIGLLEDAGVINRSDKVLRTVLLPNADQAVNAALRQLKKGKKAKV